MNETISAISTVGFPIVACCCMGIYFYKMQIANNETIEKLRDTLNNNTIVLTKLYEKLNNKEGD